MDRKNWLLLAGRHLASGSAACAIAFGLGACAQPPIGLPDESVIGFDGKNAIPPDCTALSRPSTSLDDDGRKSMEWGCATFTNLANQIANPRDLVAPQPLAPADGAVAASAMQRYETDKVTPLDKTTSRSGSDN